jgi:hypothetical protein
MLQQLSRVTRVFGGHHVALAQRPQRPQRDVLQIADRRGDEVKRGWLERRQIHALMLAGY